jgi:Cu(I)-responsive transcriptional regulator
MNIGEVAAASGVSAKMIRYYESIGLIPAAKRSENGYRVYGPAEMHTLRFVRRARALGFPVVRIGQLLKLWQDKGRASAEVKAIAEGQVAELNARVAELLGMARTLEHLAQSCHGNERPDCPSLDDLAAG